MSCCWGSLHLIIPSSQEPLFFGAWGRARIQAVGPLQPLKLQHLRFLALAAQKSQAGGGRGRAPGFFMACPVVAEGSRLAEQEAEARRLDAQQEGRSVLLLASKAR